jgi:uncharacterized protein YPO0396
LETEVASLRRRRGNGPRHQVRVRFAEAASLGPEELPFAGELLKMDPAHEEWRTAADAVLGGFARTLLVDEKQRIRLRRP